VPGFTINRICALSLFVLNKSNVNTLVRSSKIITTGIGLTSIPMIIHPIDHLVHVVMDKFRPTFGIRPYYKNEKE
jgi:mitochondrial fission process protein 1